MDIYQSKNIGKWLGLIIVLSIVFSILFFTNKFVSQFKKEEQSKMEIWVSAMNQIAILDDLNKDISFPLTVIQNNTTIPIINTYEDGRIKIIKNIDPAFSNDSIYLYNLLVEMKEQQTPLTIVYPTKEREYIFYKNSKTLTQLKYYPIAMLMLLSFFGVLTFWAFRSTKKSEQSLLWAAMAKETAHQIGTPLSSLMGWTELLKFEDIDQTPIEEIERDIERLKTITNRFSKIGSKPELKKENIENIIRTSYKYLKSRASKHTNFSFESKIDSNLEIPLNEQLLSWVLENLIKNSIDAMLGKGNLTISIIDENNYIQIQIKDNGKGIAKSNYNKIFKPGFTTKKRGWGLGLSLAKRIIEEYHHGKIFILHSEIGKGTVIALNLKKTIS